MKTFHTPRLMWPLWCGCAGGMACEALLFFTVTRPAFGAAQAGAPLAGAWSWTSIVGWHLFIAGVCLLSMWGPFVQLRTRFGEDGVRRPRFLRPSIFIKWTEVETLLITQKRFQPDVLHINARGESIDIDTLFYRRPDELISFVDERVKTCLPEFCH